MRPLMAERELAAHMQARFNFGAGVERGAGHGCSRMIVRSGSVKGDAMDGFCG